MENYLLPILEEGGPIGAAVVVAVLVVGFVLRQKGWLSSDRTKIVPSSQLSELSSQVTDLDKRLGRLEQDVEGLPTREEIHELQLMQERQSGEIQVLRTTTEATKAGVLRVEDFLINLSRGQPK
ncbi:DUF2730 family protein [Cognatishimia sp. MH4019]|uniref:DUF2730 family protein n=1 Tax=Cognatishimia sp. MH4019 TaxID=2854030 RepID=UPI001CD273C0|nr:DUF2730 family protein [Cognatishimia sp. MH4019]